MRFRLIPHRRFSCLLWSDVWQVVARPLDLWYNECTVKAEFIFWRMLFEEEQHLGDCIVNERFANTSRNPLVF